MIWANERNHGWNVPQLQLINFPLQSSQFSFNATLCVCMFSAPESYFSGRLTVTLMNKCLISFLGREWINVTWGYFVRTHTLSFLSDLRQSVSACWIVSDTELIWKRELNKQSQTLNFIIHFKELIPILPLVLTNTFSSPPTHTHWQIATVFLSLIEWILLYEQIFCLRVDSVFPAQCPMLWMPMSQHCSMTAATIVQGQTDYSHWEAAVPSVTNHPTMREWGRLGCWVALK